LNIDVRESGREAMQTPTTRPPVSDPRTAAGLYRETKARVCALVTALDEPALNTTVAACPSWSVRDVVAHVVAVAQDWVSGSLSGPPTNEQTAAQVARFDGYDIAAILAEWADVAARLDHMADTEGVEPPLGDVVSHEHDIRAAIGRPGARDSGAVWYSSDRLLDMLRAPVPLEVVVEDGQYRSGPEGQIELILRTTRFEALRWRTGRRSRAQLAAMDWLGDPTKVLDDLYIFGPALVDIIE
jgi:hypothetical protein